MVAGISGFAAISRANLSAPLRTATLLTSPTPDMTPARAGKLPQSCAIAVSRRAKLWTGTVRSTVSFRLVDEEWGDELMRFRLFG